MLYDLWTLEAGFVVSQDWTSEFLGCIEGIKGSGNLMRDVLFTTLDTLASAPKKADLLFSALLINPDDPVWPSLLEGLKQRIDPARDKKTWETFRVLELKQALRHGREVDWDTEARALSGTALARLHVIKLSRALDGKASYPAAWFEAVLAGIKKEAGRKLLQVVDAEAREDWKALYQATKELIAIENLDHDDQWYLGHAAFELGKKEEAKEALKLFLGAAKGSPEQPLARELLARLENGKT